MPKPVDIAIKPLVDEIRQRRDEIRAALKTGVTADPVWPDSAIAGTHIEDGEIVAVLLCSKILEAHIWLAFYDSFDPKDQKAVFYADELPLLGDKTPGELRAIHRVKLAFGPGSRVTE